MGWKTIKGNRYYYRSVREGKRVRSEYVGSGSTAEVLAVLDGERREEERERRETEREERRTLDEVDRALAVVHRDALNLAARTLEAAGYRLHARSEWRKRRGE